MEKQQFIDEIQRKKNALLKQIAILEEQENFLNSVSVQTAE